MLGTIPETSHGRRELEREPLERELRVRIGVRELAAHVVREHRHLPIAETADGAGPWLGLDHLDPGASSTEAILVTLLRGHLDHGAVDRILLATREHLADRALDHDGEAAPGMVVPGE